MVYRFFIGLICVSVLVIAYQHFYRNEESSGYKIAIILPVIHPALEEICAAFCKEVQDHCEATFDLYNALGDRVLLRSMAEEIAHKKYDVICAIATQPALIMKEVLRMVDNSTPLVACAVDEPVRMGLIEDGSKYNTQVVAITSEEHMGDQMDALEKQNIVYSKVLLVHSQSPDFDQTAQKLEHYLHTKGKKLTNLDIFGVAEIPIKVASFISDHDLVMVLKDNMVVSALESIVRICNEQKVPLFASDLNSSKAGAAFAYGVEEAAYGRLGGQVACRILLDKEDPSQMPIFKVQHHTFVINKQAMIAQGICDEKEQT